MGLWHGWDKWLSEGHRDPSCLLNSRYLLLYASFPSVKTVLLSQRFNCLNTCCSVAGIT